MRINCRYTFVVALLLIIAMNTAAQEKPKGALITADSLASGNYKDILTSFFQLAFDNLTGAQKEVRFSSNPFAIMMRANPDLAVDTSYRKYRVLRNINFSFAARLDTSYKFNGFSSGVQYAIINKRDYTISREFIHLTREKNYEFETLNNGIAARAFLIPSENTLRKRLLDQGRSLLNDNTFTFDKLDNDVKQIILEIIRDKKLVGLEKLVNENKKANINERVRNAYDLVKNSFQNKLLWTAGITDTTYKDQFIFSNVVLSTQLLKGITNPAKASNIEIDLNARYNFVDDTASRGRDLKRGIFRVESGINWVLKSKRNNQSMLEVKATAVYRNISKGTYTNEKENLFTLDGTLRVRIIDDTWIPLKFSYDPRSGNIFGFISVKTNFAAQKKPGK